MHDEPASLSPTRPVLHHACRVRLKLVPTLAAACSTQSLPSKLSAYPCPTPRVGRLHSVCRSLLQGPSNATHPLERPTSSQQQAAEPEVCMPHVLGRGKDEHIVWLC